ncbi:MAG: SBBP repeat-containing protein [Acidobacteria bacterium]|nr:SBBP repeat-containing protein [Acidobacteriota bacterium]
MPEQLKSTNYPVTTGTFDTTYNGGFEDLFLTKLDAAGSALTYSTYVGGSDIDNFGGIAIDTAGNVYLAGSTESSTIPSSVLLTRHTTERKT